MAIPTENWPKPWMLEVHAKAVAEGFFWLTPITSEDAESFKLRFYRIRRRSDKSMAAFIPPEYHLVMVGRWEEGEDGLGRLPIIYNKRADGKDLPRMVSASGDEVEAYTAQPLLADPAPVTLDPDKLDLSIGEEEISSLIARMRKNAKKGAGDGE